MTNTRPLLATDAPIDALKPVGFTDLEAAQTGLQRIDALVQGDHRLTEILPTLLLALREAAHPDRVLVSLERFIRNIPDRGELLDHLHTNPRAIDLLVTLIAGSQFLAEILLRTPGYFTRLIERRQLAQENTSADFYGKAQAAIAPHLDLAVVEKPAPVAINAALDALRQFQRWQLLRLGANDLLGSFDVATVTRQLSNLADSLIQICLQITARQTNCSPDNFVIVGLGKLGGGELNYSSDIDLIFLSEESGTPYQSLAQRLIQHLTKVTPEGFLYRVDMRLRPWGSTGPLVSSLAGYIGYMNQHARLWEKQALLKARPIAGSEALGQKFLQEIEPLLFDISAEEVRADVHDMKTRIERQLTKHQRQWSEVKLGEGSIRDIEFATQYLQLAHGQSCPQVRSPNTLDALNRLLNARLLNPDEHHTLTNGYTFLRVVEHHLQMMRYQQTHTLPTEPDDLENLALRLGFQGDSAGSDFARQYRQHSTAIRRIYDHRVAATTYIDPDDQETLTITRHVARMGQTYREIFSEAEIKHHAKLMARLSHDNLIEVEVTPIAGDDLSTNCRQILIVGYDYPGELSLICGLMVVHELNILSGHVFTYQDGLQPLGSHRSDRAKIVDIFTVQPLSEDEAALDEDFWQRYKADLQQQVQQLQAGQQQAAQLSLINRIAESIHLADQVVAPTLYPIDIRIDNETHPKYTILNIDTPDTVGFLFEFANALALNNHQIARVEIQTSGNRIRDSLYVADRTGNKVTGGQALFELRAATVLVKHFTHLLPHSSNPAAALTHFREFLGQLFTRPDWPNEIATLIRPEVLDALARLLGVSDFLWDDFLRMQYENLFPVIRDVEALSLPKSKEDLRAELEAIIQFAPDEEARRHNLNEFKDREMFRIDMRHILGHSTEHGEFAAELSDLAEVIIMQAYRMCFAGLKAQFGLPQTDDSSSSRMAVCALGKFGGRELGFASDIELMFIYDKGGHTAGSKSIPNSLFYERLVQAVQRSIRTKQEGIFELDLRLRPYGKAGSMATSWEKFRLYFAPDGPAWDYERQALVRLRPIAGDNAMGNELVALRDKFVYTGNPFDVSSMRGMRERQIRHLVTPGTINAKFSAGTLVDIEYLVQGIQITHGHAYPALRVPSTRTALDLLHQTGLLSAEDHQSLSQAYAFFRRLINALRMVRGHAKDLTVPPTAGEEFSFLARRLNYGDRRQELRQDLVNFTTVVQEINTRLLNQISFTPAKDD